MTGFTGMLPTAFTFNGLTCRQQNFPVSPDSKVRQHYLYATLTMPVALVQQDAGLLVK